MAGPVGRTIYHATNGRVNLGIGDNHGSGAEVVVRAAAQVANNGAKTEENYFHDNRMRIERTAAVMSLVTSDYASTKAVQNYNSLDLTNTNPGSTGISNKEWMDRIGLGDSAGNAAVSFANTQTFTANYNVRGADVASMNSRLDSLSSSHLNTLASTGKVNVDLGGGHSAYIEIKDTSEIVNLQNTMESGGNWRAQMDTIGSISVQESRVGSSFGGFSNNQKADMAAHGSFQGNAMFTSGTVNFDPGATGRQQTSKMFSAARSEENNKNFVTNRGGARNSREAMSMIHDKSVEYLNTTCADAGVKFGGSAAEIRRQCAHAQASLDEKIRNLKNSGGSPAQIAKLQNEKAVIAKAQEGFTEDGRRGGLTGKQKYGMRVLGSEVIGRDMMLGIDVYANTARITTAAVRSVYRGYLRTTGHALTGELFISDKAKNRIGNFATRHGLHMPEPLKNISNGVNRAGEFQKQRLDRLKAKDQARKSGSLREWRRNDRNARFAARNERRAAQITRRENRSINLKNRAKATSGRRKAFLEARANRLDRINARAKGISGFIERTNKGWNNLTQWGRDLRDKLLRPFKNVWNGMTKPFRFIADKLNAITNFIKKRILKPILLGVGVPCVLVLATLFIIPLMAFVVLHFVSEIPQPSQVIASALHPDYVKADGTVNYIQLIVDGAMNDMGEPLMDALKRDAKGYYLHQKVQDTLSWTETKHTVPTFTDEQIKNSPTDDDGYHEGVFVWDKDTTEAEVGNFYATEEAALADSAKNELSGVNANLLPITSMMHVRFFDDIDFENWNTARAYVYYMYAMSHSVSSYTYKEVESCSNDALFEIADGVDYRIPSIDSGGNAQYHYLHQKCTNVFIHGYNADDSKAVNKAKATATNLALKAVNKLKISAISNWLDIPDFKTTSPGTEWDRLPYQTVNIAGTDWTFVCDHYMTISYDKDADDGGYNYLFENMKPTCGKEEDTNARRDTQTLTSDANHNPTYTTTTTTNTDYHVHDADCYPTLYVCLGHCGGHITPVVNTQMYMDYENLANQDFFKVVKTKFMGFEDERKIQSTEIDSLDWHKILGFTSLNEWKKYWYEKANKEWFTPYPTDTLARAEYCFKGTVNLFDESVAFWRELILTGDSGSAVAAMDAKNARPEGADKDMYDFRSWFVTDDNGNPIVAADGSTTINKDLMEEMETFYGRWKDKDGNVVDFDIGVEMWDNFDVHFPVGGRTLSTAQQQKIIDYLIARGVDPNSSQMAVLTEAMRCCGAFSYDLTGNAHNNGVKNDKGRSDCSGFVCGVLNRSLGTNFNQSAAEFGSAGGLKKPGSIISHSNGRIGQNGETYTGHVMIYVGSLSGDAAPDGDGQYVIDCSSSVGGSSLRRMDPGKLLEYNQTYNY